MPKLTEQDLNDLQYFWKERGDLERMSSFKKLLPIIKEERPELFKAYNDYKVSVKILDDVIECLV